MKRILSKLLAVALAAALLVCPAAAAAAPWLQLNGQSVSIQGLSEPYTALQITLNLNQEAAGSFQFAPALSSGDIHTAYTVNGNSVTLYISSKSTLGQGSALSLGSLIGQASVESVSNLKLVNVGSNDTSQTASASLEIRNGSTPGGGFNPGPSWGGGDGVTRYPVQAAPGTSGGSVQFGTTHAAPGETVSFTTTPNPGYILNSLAVTDSTGRGVAVSGLGGGKWSFVMPASAVTISVAFTPAQPAFLPFRDVAQGEWFRDAVSYVYTARLMNGTSPDLFSPWETTTRGMIVTILHRLEGTPDAGAGTAFTDVAGGAYYAQSVAWASANGIVNGFEDGSFRPGDAITREQMAAIFMRYARYRGVDVTAQASLDGFPDQAKVSSYAREAMAWSVSTGLIGGMDGLLVPGGSATRAQAATILMRLCVNVLEAP